MIDIFNKKWIAILRDFSWGNMSEEKRFLVGIDLGTTNSAVAYIDRLERKKPALLRLRQLGSLGRLEDLATLPSICYLVSPYEDLPHLPWSEKGSPYVTGSLALELGGKVPSRLVRSAKSWLSYSGAKRKEKILPLECLEAELRISPLQALALYLDHIRQAWNHCMAKKDASLILELQEIAITVPASFDEVARSLTVEAAKLAGFSSFTLLEEPQAAFYDWLVSYEGQLNAYLKAGDLVLVCDVGGGTTDFSLIEVLPAHSAASLSFSRSFVGRHLLLGGDNMDEAICHLAESKLKAGPPLEGEQWLQLRLAAKKAKEELLSVQGPESYRLLIQGVGSKVIQGSKKVTLEKKEVTDLLLDGFFALYPWSEATLPAKGAAVKKIGLPYEEEPSITKQLALFLKRTVVEQGLKAPSAVLFNGAAMTPACFQQRIIDSLSLWFADSPPAQILPAMSLDFAVAKGAAYFSAVRQGEGLRIQGGSARAFYLAVATEEGEKALTLMPKGSEEGTSFTPSFTFWLTPNQPVTFSLYSSEVRLQDAAGSLIAIDLEEMSLMAPMHALLRYGKGGVEPIAVSLSAELTAVGTLELTLAAKETSHRWQLEYQVRTFSPSSKSPSSSQVEALFDAAREAQMVQEARLLLQAAFNVDNREPPTSLMEQLEKLIGLPRLEWPISLLRKLYSEVMAIASLRQLSPTLEGRWWNLLGFLLRPGYGYPLDEERMRDLWRLLLVDLKRPLPLESNVQRLIALRRVAGGFNQGQQMHLFSNCCHRLFKHDFKERALKNLFLEQVRLSASLELIEARLKVQLGDQFLQRIQKKQAWAEEYWALARLGARHLVYGSLANLVPVKTVSSWLQALLPLIAAKGEDKGIFLIVQQLARKTSHRACNIEEPLKEALLKNLKGHSQFLRLSRLLQEESHLTEKEREVILADRLPCGLSIQSDR